MHLHAALRRPEYYRGVVMLDSPVLTRADQWLLRTAKRFGFIDRITPAGRTLGRREVFNDRDSARDYFAGKSLFRHFDPDCLEAYVEHGLQAMEQGLQLRFDPATEISIYRSIPHTSPAPARQLQVPLAMVRGERSSVIRRHHTLAVRGMPKGEYLQCARRPHVPAGAPDRHRQPDQGPVRPLEPGMSAQVQEVRLSLGHIELAAHLFGPRGRAAGNCPAWLAG